MAAVSDEEAKSDREKNVSYVIVNNIPKLYRSADLRNFFSEFIETSGFDCFHFRHRPEVQQKKSASALQSDRLRKDDDVSATTRKTTTCCVVRVLADRVGELLRMYDKKHWIGRDGQTLPTRCFIRKVRVRNDESQALSHYLTRGEQKALRAEEGAVLSEADLKTLIELRPPPAMPNGNVGTPTKVFLGLIQACKLPPYLIKKLGLVFPRSRSRRLYGSVPLDYGDTARSLGRRENKVKGGAVTWEMPLVRTATGAIISNAGPSRPESGDDGSLNVEAEQNFVDVQKNREESDDEECEEWDRHEALHNDVTNQERTRERLFEEELEVQWEKGGSGLVFYTDAQFWDEVEGDFDAKTSDDWDVDMSIYYNPESGDKDARDYVSMLHFKRLRETAEEMDDENRLASFEKYTKGFGSRILKQQGWSEGEGVGRAKEGIATPIDDAGQHPWDRSGFGFRGEKLVRKFSKSKRKRNRGEAFISTVYDRPRETDPPDPLLRSHNTTYLHFRKSFVKGQQ
ncbi:G patch domain-containing protein 3 [Rhipicephalus sanguineus]|uniref:G patch domain-containing protein 3 n=1 Tax=Rhipicephalus sanguineus TaxID=34632 RepID=UPI001894E022|nr:G patch domain-containing protein 3 [Rhipicephalus sanguineus]